MDDKERLDNFSFDSDDYDYEPSIDDDSLISEGTDDTASPVEAAEQPAAAENDKSRKSSQDGDENLGRRKAGKGRSKKTKNSTGKKNSPGKKLRVPLIITGALILGTAVGLFAYSLSTIDENKVMNNVYIENLDVSGLTYDEALASVNATYLFENKEITLTDGENSFAINGADIGLAAMPEETTHKAFEYCKDGNVFQNAYHSFMLLFNEHVIVPAPEVSEELLDGKLVEAGNALKGEWKQHYAEFNEENIATVKSGQTGFNGDISTAKEQVLTAFNNEIFNDIHVDYATAPPDDMTLENLDLLIYKDPVDARYEINGNEVNITQSETGRYIDKDAVAEYVPQIFEGCEPVSVPYLVSEPAVTTQILNDKLFANTLSSYSTNYGGSTENRKANVARAASLISGTVVAPGEVFSFNDTVGHRTRENGFYTAKEYINGESVDGIGGGTCQVSSTLYSAVLYADFGIVERLNHMMTVGYIPLGQDATVSDGGVDFKFRNTSDYPIKIAAYTNGSSITVSIIGTAWEPARRVSISNTSSQVGENTVVRSTRYVYSGDTLISTDSLNSSTYMPHKKSVAEQEAAAASQSSYSESSSESSSSSYDDDDEDDDGESYDEDSNDEDEE